MEHDCTRVVAILGVGDLERGKLVQSTPKIPYPIV
jgi:hypothetical protein